VPALQGSKNYRHLTVAGLDMASSPKNRGICVIEALVRPPCNVIRCGTVVLGSGASDEDVLSLFSTVDAVGVDIPLAWPLAFSNLLSGGAEPSLPLADRQLPSLESLRFRTVDLYVKTITGRYPLSVSSDLVAVPALKMRLLLWRMEPEARKKALEVYPAASLARWGLPNRGYKGSRGASVRQEIAGAIVSAIGQKLTLTPKQKESLVRDHNVLDSFVCALTALAQIYGLCDAPDEAGFNSVPPEEGWIWVPASDSLSRLFRWQEHRAGAGVPKPAPRRLRARRGSKTSGASPPEHA
jgi:hypothetical protein